MKKTKKTDPVSVRLDPHVKAELEVLAQADDRSLSSYIARLCAQHVAKAKSSKSGRS